MKSKLHCTGMGLICINVDIADLEVKMIILEISKDLQLIFLFLPLPITSMQVAG